MNEKIEKIEEKLNDHSMAFEILKDLRDANRRMFRILIVIISLWAGTIAGFIWYLNQYDYITTHEIEASGIINQWDNSGVITSTDVSPEMWDLFMEWFNGEN